MKVARLAGTLAATSVTFVLSLAVAIALHLNTPRTRRLVVRVVDKILAASFRGPMRIERLGGLGLQGVSGVDATVCEPAGGRPVLVLRGARVSVAGLALLRSAVLGKGRPLEIRLPEVSVDSLDWKLDTDAGGKLSLMNAFQPRSSGGPPNRDARGIRLVIPEIRLKQVSARGPIGGLQLDVGLENSHGSLTVAPDQLECAVASARVLARDVVKGSDLDGPLRAELTNRSDPGANVSASLTWEGSLGTITPARAHVEAHGTLPRVDTDIDAVLGRGSFRGNANFVFGREAKARLEFAAHDIDVHELAAPAPPSRLEISGVASAAKDAHGVLVSRLSARFSGGPLGKHRLPPAFIAANVSRSPLGVLHARADVDLQDPATRLSVELSPKGKSSVVDFSLDADVPDLDRASVLRHAGRGSGRLAARGSFDLETMTVDANLEAAVEHLARPSLAIGSIALDGHATGRLAAPLIDVDMHSKDIVSSGVRFTSVDVHAAGLAATPHVEATAHGPDIPDTDASLDLALGPGLTLDRVRVGMVRAGEHALLAVGRLKFAREEVEVEDARLEGLGAPATADLAIGPQAVRVRASTQGIDLARVGRLAHLEQKLERGALALDVDIDLRRGGAHGRGTLDLRQANLGQVRDVAVHLEAQPSGRSFAAKAQGQAAGIGFVNVDAPRVSLGGGAALSLASWKRAWGRVAVDGRVELEKVAALIPAESLPFAEVKGEIAFKARIERDDSEDMTPDVGLSVVTDRLVLSPKTAMAHDIDDVGARSSAPWRLEGVNFDVNASVNGQSGSIDASAHLRDDKGELARLNAKADRPPWGDVFHDSGRLVADLRRTPLELRVGIPERGIGSMPPLLRQNYLTGKVEGDLSWSGTMLDPLVHAEVALHKSRVGATGPPVSLEFELKADYARSHGNATLLGRLQDREVVKVDTEFHGAVADLLGTGSSARWQAGGRARFAHFPIAAIVPLDDKLISGELTGDVTLADLHEDARANVALAIDSLRVGSVGYKAASLVAKADHQVFDATMRIDQDDGFALARAHAPATWGTAIAPHLGGAQPLQVALSAKNFRIAGLLPLVDSWLDELDGRVDADTQVELDPGSRRVRIAGGVALNGGAVEAVAGGGEFHDIAATAHFSPDGVFTLEKLTAAGMTGQVQATGSARFDGASLQSAHAEMLIPEDSPLPIRAGGSEIANVDARVRVSEATSADGRTMKVDVDVQRLRAALPQGASRKVQALGRMPNVRIGARRGHPEAFVVIPLDSTKKKAEGSSPGTPRVGILVEAQLHDVKVLRGSDLKVDLKGRVEVKADGATAVTGQVHLEPGGVLLVQGRKFKVENGTVTFVGEDPSNPQVVVKAGWTAPDGTVVYANFLGPLKTGKVTLSSEPPLAQQDIVELLAFGTTNGKQAQNLAGAPATTALGTVGGEATQPINQALNRLGLGAFTTRIETSESWVTKPEVEVQIAKDISVQIAVVLGQPPPGVNPDRTLVTVDWRFLSRWSLLSTIGDAGTAIFDILWQRRY